MAQSCQEGPGITQVPVLRVRWLSHCSHSSGVHNSLLCLLPLEQLSFYFPPSLCNEILFIFLDASQNVISGISVPHAVWVALDLVIGHVYVTLLPQSSHGFQLRAYMSVSPSCVAFVSALLEPITLPELHGHALTAWISEYSVTMHCNGYSF